MVQKSTIFRDDEHVYHADTCEKVVNAYEKGTIDLKALVHGAYPGKQLPPKMLPQIKSVGYWDAGSDQDWGLASHRNEGLELTYLTTGELGFAADNEIYTLSPGDLTITRPWQPHRVGNPNIGASRLYWLIIDLGVRHPHQTWKWPSWLVLDDKDMADLTTILSQNERHVWKGIPELEKCFKEIGKVVKISYSSDVPKSRLVLLINELLIVVLEILRKRQFILKPSLTSAQRSTMLFLKDLENTLDQPWTLDTMAAHVGLKRTRFSHYCRKLKNMTPAQYLHHLRVEKAKKLIREEPECDITSIAMDCGFASSQYFATSFKRLTGTTPRQFRKL